ncbi:MAG: biotin--[acetyl-CoA-carboxylase] ligase [Clostridia bacterium]|nr:biotin--[acetyl-CoA-carboxylase] ligase [Clostridia bacterium]
MATKELILETLLKNKGKYISGEELSKDLNVSRMAINKAIQGLKQQGYTIKSVTNKGYLLENEPDVLNKLALAAELSKERVENIEVLESIDSTNIYAKNLAQNGVNNKYVVISNEQTKGKGRLGRTFVSPKNKGIYLSIIVKPNRDISNLTSITAFSSVAVCKAIENVYNIKTNIKWVNDVYINGKKVCGILTEASIEGETGKVDYLVIGIGINVNESTNEFPEEIKDIATSLKIQTGKEMKRNILCVELIKQLDTMIDNLDKNDEYFTGYKDRCNTIGKEVEINTFTEKKLGFVKALNEDFSLTIEYPNGLIEKLSSGEVSIKNIK